MLHCRRTFGLSLLYTTVRNPAMSHATSAIAPGEQGSDIVYMPSLLVLRSRRSHYRLGLCNDLWMIAVIPLVSSIALLALPGVLFQYT